MRSIGEDETHTARLSTCLFENLLVPYTHVTLDMPNALIKHPKTVVPACRFPQKAF